MLDIFLHCMKDIYSVWSSSPQLSRTNIYGLCDCPGVLNKIYYMGILFWIYSCSASFTIMGAECLRVQSQ